MKNSLCLIINKDVRKLVERISYKNILTITEKADYSQNLPKISNTLGIILLSELKWKNFYFSLDTGLQLARELRSIHRYPKTIIITSLCHYSNEQEYRTKLENSNNPNSTILKDRTIKYVPLDHLLKLEAKDIASLFANQLTETQLDDLNHTLFDYENGFISEFLHDLRYKIESAESSGKERLKQLLHQEINVLTSRFKHKETELERVVSASLEPVNGKLTPYWTGQLLSNIEDVFNEPSSNLTNSSLDKTIEILYIDDSKQSLDLLSERLKIFNINCFTTTKLDKALDIVKANKNIRVILCDYRFYDDDGKLSKYQGYDIIKEIEAAGYKYSSIILTSFAREYLPHINTLHKAVAFPKEMIFSESPNRSLFQLYKLIDSRDSKEYFDSNPLFNDHSFYRHYKEYTEDNHYINFEKEINEAALRFIKDFKSNCEFQIPKMPQAEIGASLKKEGTNLKAFRGKLKYRRIFLGLWQLKKIGDLVPVQTTRPKAKTLKGKYTMTILYLNIDRYDQIIKMTNSLLNDSTYRSNLRHLHLKGKINYTVENLNSMEEMNLLPEEEQWLIDNISILKTN